MNRHEIPEPPHIGWLLFVMLWLCILCLQGCAKSVSEPIANPVDMKRAIAAKRACEGWHAVWVSQNQIECRKEL